MSDISVQLEDINMKWISIPRRNQGKAGVTTTVHHTYFFMLLPLRCTYDTQRVISARRSSAVQGETSTNSGHNFLRG